MDANIFVNPPIEYRIVPFWFWNSALDEGEIVRQIHEMAEKGIGGFCLSARPGLRIPYLSNAWFDRVDIAVKTAKEHGLQVWLHDEFPSPGSLSGERVALGFPQYRAQYLTFRETTVQGGQQVDIELPWSTVLRAIAVPLRRDRCLWENAEDIGEYIGLCQRREIFQEVKDKNAYHAHRYLGQEMAYRLYWKAPAGRWRVLVFMQRAFEPPEFSGASFDPYNAEAVAHFLETACQPYADRLGDALGKTIPALLTSEATAPGNPLPWTTLLASAFLERNQYDLLNCLPALITSFGPNTARIRYDYFQTLSELLRDNFHKTCADWCADRKIRYASTVAPLRSAHRSGLQIPGTSGEKGKVDAPPVRDSGPQAASYRHSPRFTTSVAHQSSSARTLNTCFQDAGWSLTLQDMKWTVDRLAAQGCNLFNFHAFFYTLDGLRKHDSPPSQFQQNPFWKNFRLISDYTARLSYALSLGKRTPNIAILDPVTSLWSHLGHPTRDWTYLGYDPDEAKLTTRLASDWAYLLESLDRMQREYDVLDPETLAEAQVSGTRLRAQAATYDTLIIPPISNLEREAFECIREFINAGGRVICLGLLPVEDIQEGTSVVEAFSRITDMEPGRMIRDYVGHELGVHVVQRNSLYLIRTGGSLEKNRAAFALQDLLDDILPRPMAVETDKKGTSALLCHQRETEKEKLFFLTNTVQASFEGRVSLDIPTKYKNVERWCLETGRRTTLPSRREGSRLTVDLTFERMQSHLLVASEGKTQPLATQPAPTHLSLDLDGAWKVDPEEDNCLRLDHFRLQIDHQNRGVKQGWHTAEYKDSRWLTVNPSPFIEQVRQFPSLPGLPFQFTSDNPDLPVQANLGLPLVCWYRTTFSADLVPGKLALVMDRSAIQGDYQVYLNGARLPSNAFRPTFRYDHNNVTCAIGRRVSKGKNVIAVRVELKELTEGLLDAFYLFGRFGVKNWRSNYLRLSKPVERGPLNRLDDLRMPFFAGTVAYSRDISFPKPPDTEQFTVSLEKEFKDVSDVVELFINGHSLGVRAWAPYRWVGETAWLKQGKNRVVLRFTNTLERQFTGRVFQPRLHRSVPVKF